MKDWESWKNAPGAEKIRVTLRMWSKMKTQRVFAIVIVWLILSISLNFFLSTSSFPNITLGSTYVCVQPSPDFCNNNELRRGYPFTAIVSQTSFHTNNLSDLRIELVGLFFNSGIALGLSTFTVFLGTSLSKSTKLHITDKKSKGRK